MKKLALALASILVLGATSLIADSDVEVSDNIGVQVISESTIEDSSIGLAVEASDSTVVVSNNIDVAVITDSEVTNSSIGTSIKAD